MGNKKKRVNIVYSTNPDYSYEDDDYEVEETLAPNQQNLRVSIDRKQRKGKEVTLITGFVGTEDDLKALGKTIKQKCGVGGAVKDGEIMVQGNHLKKVLEILKTEGYKAKQSGGA
ncbi:translation initiation factor [Crocinitomix algicola]|uniref:translation initiation factor n=1 Tax=Crocinitomix algicola TaxID=1740263 RepID=UPI000A4A9A42|nr:translation initiation factor [Crocinitomix algicola]